MPFTLKLFLSLQYSAIALYSAIAQQSLVDQGLLSVDASQLHSDTPLKVVLLWTSDGSESETPVCQRTILNCQYYAP